jgi:hypothetical protein
MKSLVLPLAGGAAALALLASALPLAAHAQIATGVAADANAVVGDSERWPLVDRERWLSAHVGMARNDGTLGDAEYHRLREQLDQIRGDEDRMRADHGNRLTEDDRLSLAARLDGVAIQLRDSGFQKPW